MHSLFKHCFSHKGEGKFSTIVCFCTGVLGHPSIELLADTVSHLAALGQDAEQIGQTLHPSLARNLHVLAEPLGVLSGEWQQVKLPEPKPHNNSAVDKLVNTLLLAVQALHTVLGEPGKSKPEQSLQYLREILHQAFDKLNLERVERCANHLVQWLAQHGTSVEATTQARQVECWHILEASSSLA